MAMSVGRVFKVTALSDILSGAITDASPNLNVNLQNKNSTNL